MRPFHVYYRVNVGWCLHQRYSTPGWFQYGFESAGDAIDYAYKQWPWPR